MPCYLFTYHAYGSWMPDREQGYVRRKQGVFAADSHMAQCYRRNLAKDSTAEFNEHLQSMLVETVLDACSFLASRCHGVATDPSHVHCLISWKHEKAWERISRSIKHRMTLDLKKIQQQKWLSKGGSRKRVKDHSHFDYSYEQLLA